MKGINHLSGVSLSPRLRSGQRWSNLANLFARRAPRGRPRRRAAAHAGAQRYELAYGRVLADPFPQNIHDMLLYLWS